MIDVLKARIAGRDAESAQYKRVIRNLAKARARAIRREKVDSVASIDNDMSIAQSSLAMSRVNKRHMHLARMFIKGRRHAAVETPPASHKTVQLVCWHNELKNMTDSIAMYVQVFGPAKKRNTTGSTIREWLFH